MSKKGTVVICDAGPVLHLDELGCFKLLRDFQRIIFSETVVQEIKRHRSTVLKQRIVSFDVISEPLPPDYELLTLCRMFALHAGEIEALSLMKSFPEAIFLTDDSAARLVGKRLGYKVHGTIGILIRSIRRKMLKPQEVVTILRQIPQKSTLHIKPSFLEELVQQLEEEFDL
jgi:predicted nucleic acid-binding protein